MLKWLRSIERILEDVFVNTRGWFLRFARSVVRVNEVMVPIAVAQDPSAVMFVNAPSLARSPCS